MYQFQEQFHEYLQTSLKFQMNPRVVNVFSYEQWHAWWWDSMVTLSPAPSRSVHVLCLVFIIIPGTIVHSGHHDPAVTAVWPLTWPDTGAGSRVRARVATSLPVPWHRSWDVEWIMMNQIKLFFSIPHYQWKYIVSGVIASSQVLFHYPKWVISQGPAFVNSPPPPRMPMDGNPYPKSKIHKHPNFHLI